jgi:uncharacterized protein YuzE
VGGTCRANGGKRNAYILFEMPQGKTLFVIPMRDWEDNIKIDLKETGCVA